jgi:hypothetical protein
MLDATPPAQALYMVQYFMLSPVIWMATPAHPYHVSSCVEFDASGIKTTRTCFSACPLPSHRLQKVQYTYSTECSVHVRSTALLISAGHRWPLLLAPTGQCWGSSARRHCKVQPGCQLRHAYTARLPTTSCQMRHLARPITVLMDGHVCVSLQGWLVSHT